MYLLLKTKILLHQAYMISDNCVYCGWVLWFTSSQRILKYLALRIPDEGYSRIQACAQNMISTVLVLFSHQTC